MKKIFTCVILSAAMIFSSACTSSEPLPDKSGDTDGSDTKTPPVSETSETGALFYEPYTETDAQAYTRTDNDTSPIFSAEPVPSEFDSVEEYCAAAQKYLLPDCYILKNPPENAVIENIILRKGSFVSAHYRVPLAEKYKAGNYDEYGTESLTKIVCQRFLLGDGETSFKINVLDKVDIVGYQKLEANGREYYYIPELHPIDGESALIGYQVEFLEDGEYFYIHIPPFGSIDNMTDYLEVVKAAPTVVPSSSKTALSGEEADLSKAAAMAELYRSLEDAGRNEEKIRQVTGEELKSVDFTDCSVAALDGYGIKIYERLSEEKVKEFTDCIAQAEISSEEYGEIPGFTGGSTSDFQITLNTGEQIYIGTVQTEDADIIIINDVHGFRCDKESLGRLREWHSEIYRRFEEKSRSQ